MSRVSGWIRKGGAILLVGVVALMFTRNPGLALLAGMFAYSVMSRLGWYPGKSRKASPQAASAVRTAYLEISLDHATGAISGRVLQGRFAGRALPDLTPAERFDVLAELRANDAKGVQLFEAWLDRVSPGWNAGGGQYGGGRESARGRGMSVDEAYLVLGLNRGATRDEIQAAHRNLMKRFHPDQGGSTYLASQVNEAKDVLLKHIKA